MPTQPCPIHVGSHHSTQESNQTGGCVCVLLLLLRIQVYMHHVGPWQEVGAALHLELGNDDMSQPLALDPLVLTH